MKLTELLINQNVNIQLEWGIQKIEFMSSVLDLDEDMVYVTPYVHNGSFLELNVTPDKEVTCNVFADNPLTGQRLSWRNIELTTITRKNQSVYSLKTNGFNHIANNEDRRLHARTIIMADGQMFEPTSEVGVNIKVRDISDIGISFEVPQVNEPKSPHIIIKFVDTIDNRTFDVKAECAIARTEILDDKLFIGSRIVGENKDFQLYSFMRRLKEKKKYRETSGEKAQEVKVDETNVEDNQ